jgi:AcrR family transcriptional regulator
MKSLGNIEIREPKQQRSIEKKKRIINAGFKLICEKGYHNTNTAEIAKEAGVSTGIVYNYFADKKDIFLAAVQSYGNNLVAPMYERISKINKPIELTELIKEFIAIFVQSHYISEVAHEEMLAMSHSDQDVAKLFRQFEIETCNTVVGLMKQIAITPTNPYEKVYLSIGLIENLCHGIVYHKHESMNYEIMTDEIVKIIVGMLST